LSPPYSSCRRAVPWYIGVDQVEFAGPVAAVNIVNALQ